MSLILASQSRARKAMLKEKGIVFESIPADLDEEKIIENLTADDVNIELIPVELAKAKALAISNQYSKPYIVGSDQVLIMDQKIYSKVLTKEEAVERLMIMQGRGHHLISGVAVAKDNKIIWQTSDRAVLNMKTMNSTEIEDYIHQAEDDVYHCVGCYALEGLGKGLFNKVDGDFYTILGMPLMPLLKFLKSEGVIT